MKNAIWYLTKSAHYLNNLYQLDAEYGGYVYFNCYQQGQFDQHRTCYYKSIAEALSIGNFSTFRGNNQTRGDLLELRTISVVDSLI